MNEPLVSVVIPCYNHDRYVQECIQSIIDQTYCNLELIIIDDGSSDQSVVMIDQMSTKCNDRFVRFDFRHRPNKGLCATLNEALEWCQGEFVSPIASDDVMLAHKIRKQVSSFSSPLIAGVFGNVAVLQEGVIKNPVQSAELARPTVETVYSFRDIFFRKSKLPAPTAMLRRSDLIEVGGYDEDIAIEDFYLWLKLTESGKQLVHIDETLALYRRHPGNQSQNSEIMLDGVLQILSRYDDRKDFPEALARSLLVHAGDLACDGAGDSFRYLVRGLRQCPSLLFSKLFFVYFYRYGLGLRFSGKRNGHED